MSAQIFNENDIYVASSDSDNEQEVVVVAEQVNVAAVAKPMKEDPMRMCFNNTRAHLSGDAVLSQTQKVLVNELSKLVSFGWNDGVFSASFSENREVSEMAIVDWYLEKCMSAASLPSAFSVQDAEQEYKKRNIREDFEKKTKRGKNTVSEDVCKQNEIYHMHKAYVHFAGFFFGNDRTRINFSAPKSMTSLQHFVLDSDMNRRGIFVLCLLRYLSCFNTDEMIKSLLVNEMKYDVLDAIMSMDSFFAACKSEYVVFYGSSLLEKIKAKITPRHFDKSVSSYTDLANIKEFAPKIFGKTLFKKLSDNVSTTNFRKFQRDLLSYVADNISTGSISLMNAPAGAGKTLLVAFLSQLVEKYNAGIIAKYANKSDEERRENMPKEMYKLVFVCPSDAVRREAAALIQHSSHGATWASAGTKSGVWTNDMTIFGWNTKRFRPAGGMVKKPRDYKFMSQERKDAFNRLAKEARNTPTTTIISGEEYAFEVIKHHSGDEFGASGGAYGGHDFDGQNAIVFIDEPTIGTDESAEVATNIANILGLHPKNLILSSATLPAEKDMREMISWATCPIRMFGDNLFTPDVCTTFRDLNGDAFNPFTEAPVNKVSFHSPFVRQMMSSVEMKQCIAKTVSDRQRTTPSWDAELGDVKINSRMEDLIHTTSMMSSSFNGLGHYVPKTSSSFFSAAPEEWISHLFGQTYIATQSPHSFVAAHLKSMVDKFMSENDFDKMVDSYHASVELQSQRREDVAKRLSSTQTSKKGDSRPEHQSKMDREFAMRDAQEATTVALPECKQVIIPKTTTFSSRQTSNNSSFPSIFDKITIEKKTKSVVANDDAKGGVVVENIVSEDILFADVFGVEERWIAVLLCVFGIAVLDSTHPYPKHYIEKVLTYAKQGTLTLVISDEGLCYGTNFPFSSVLITDDFASAHSVNTILQCCARTGRSGNGMEGNVLLSRIAIAKIRSWIKNDCEEPERGYFVCGVNRADSVLLPSRSETMNIKKAIQIANLTQSIQSEVAKLITFCTIIEGTHSAKSHSSEGYARRIQMMRESGYSHNLVALQTKALPYFANYAAKLISRLSDKTPEFIASLPSFGTGEKLYAEEVREFVVSSVPSLIAATPF